MFSLPTQAVLASRFFFFSPKDTPAEELEAVQIWMRVEFALPSVCLISNLKWNADIYIQQDFLFTTCDNEQAPSWGGP